MLAFLFFIFPCSVLSVRLKGLILHVLKPVHPASAVTLPPTTGSSTCRWTNSSQTCLLAVTLIVSTEQAAKAEHWAGVTADGRCSRVISSEIGRIWQLMLDIRWHCQLRPIFYCLCTDWIPVVSAGILPRYSDRRRALVGIFASIWIRKCI